MAEQKGKETARSNSSPSKSNGKITKKHKRFGDTIFDEIILILIIAGSIVVLISLLSEKMGIVGHLISSFLKGMLGIGSIFVPLLAIGYSLWMLMSEEKKGMWMRLTAAILGLLCLSAGICVLFHPFFDSTIGPLSRSKYYYDNASFLNGGIIGGWLGSGLVRAFGKIGSILILLVLLLIAIILGTGKSFLKGISNTVDFHNTRKQNHRDKIKTQAERIQKQEVQEAEKRTNRAKIEEKKVSKANKTQKSQFNYIIEEGEEDKSVDLVEETMFSKAKKFFSIKERKPVFDYEAEELLEESRLNDEYTAEEFDEELPENTALQRQYEKDIVTPPPVIHASGGFLEDDENIKETFEEIAIEEIAIEEIAIEEEETEQAFEPEVNMFKENESIKAVNVPYSLTKKTEEVQGGVHTLIKNEPDQPYVFPPLELLGLDNSVQNKGSKVEMLKNAQKLEDTLKSFGVEATVMQINKGPTVTRYELSPSKGVKVSKIVNLADDIALNLAASGIRIEAPIPGKAAVGIEVPNKEAQSVYLRSVMQTETFQKFPSRLAFALGQDIAGNPIVTDIAKMPHLLIAGATGSGKSVCINTIITSILYKADPKEVKLLLVDPKVVELSVYNGIPHLLIPVVTDPKKAASALNWAVREMLARYNDFAAFNVRDISGFNAMKREKGEEEGCMSQMVIIIDELADLMMAVPGEVEDSICRLAQMARAAGMHLIIATQRPSVDVITGVIKANIPSRLAFAVSSGIDSRTILDMVGAEKLLGKGDMLFYPAGMSKPQRIQGAFVTDKEVESIVQFVKRDGQAQADQEMIEKITSSGKLEGPGGDVDEFFDQAVDLVVEKEKASASMLQRQFRIGYNRASRLIEDLENNGIVGPEDGSKPRKVLITKAALYEMRNPISQNTASQNIEENNKMPNPSNEEEILNTNAEDD